MPRVLAISDFDAVTFDVYGTLIDWEPSIIAYLQNWSRQQGAEFDDGTLLMAFDRARAVLQAERPALPYHMVLRRALVAIGAEFALAADVAAQARFAAGPTTWPAYGDAPAGLAALKSWVLVGALSNIDDALLAHSCRRLAVTFDLVVTAERVGAYKPDRPHFETAIADLAARGIRRERILHVGQSLRADIAPANQLGLASVWIARPGRRLGLSGDGAAEARPDLTVSSVAELVARLVGNDGAP
ncbi:HAD family hydrolase [Phreatobacter sp. AB_2022a]|uniref:HAD family hydrolase n=1 Tax=Phreatobacter sp. AB_2022a TaxID=3003134 RepID=UPI002286D990|nr:HAD family hydrolase [Phreatobacter sp. AB_2022a]MCZ0734254.1 HAD hydrolase-like protein [Phreatobacter sp. AB_2022a]